MAGTHDFRVFPLGLTTVNIEHAESLSDRGLSPRGRLSNHDAYSCHSVGSMVAMQKQKAQTPDCYIPQASSLVWGTARFAAECSGYREPPRAPTSG